MKFFLPDFYAKNIFLIPVSFYKENGVKTIICDLDNTLDAFDTLFPSSRVRVLKEKLNREGIELIIISNNHSKRVSDYATSLGVRYLNSAKKPFKKRVLNFLKNNNISKDNVIMIGDQLVTDVRCAKNAKIRVILTDPIVKRDQFTTHFNRMIDRPIRRMYRKKHLLVAREVKYE